MDQADNPFSVLGVPIDASLEEINAAWKAKVKKLHPDRYPEAPPEIVARLNEEMSRVNAAHKMLNDDLPQMRARFSPDASGADHQPDSASRHARPSDFRMPTNLCEVCGSVNTDVFKFTRQIGLILMRRVGRVEARLCRDCALTIGREYQSRTLSTGWWGAISFFANIAYIFSNASELNRASRLKWPASVPGYRSRPLDPGNSVFARPISWIGPAIIGIVLALIVASGANQSQDNSFDGFIPAPRVGFAVGNCVVGFSSFSAVTCDEPHTGKIVERVSTQFDCPITAESFVTVNGGVLCIDEDL